jgi:polar amino acid transport system permease protein
MALNMTSTQALRRIIIPQAFIRMLPPFGNLTIELLKFTSLVSFITLTELTFAGKLLFQTVGRREEIYTIVLVMYFLMALPLTLVIRWIERRWGRSLMAGRPA